MLPATRNARRVTPYAVAAVVGLCVLPLLAGEPARLQTPLERELISRGPMEQLLPALETARGTARRIPGRLLVKVDPAELEPRFTLPTPNRGCGVAALRATRIIPPKLAIDTVEDLGAVVADRSAVVLRLQKPQSKAVVLRAMRDSVASPSQTSLLFDAHGRVGGVIVRVDSGLIEKAGLEQCTDPYFRLRASSTLRKSLASTGVKSMRRVFRATEVRDASYPSTYKVRPMSALLAIAAERYAQRTARWRGTEELPANMENWFVVRLRADIDLDRVIAVLSKHKGVEAVSADYPVVTTQAPNDPEYTAGRQWGLNNVGGAGSLADFDVNIEPAWNDPVSAQPVVVAVIDSGFKEDLDELRNQLWTNTAETPANGVDEDCNGYVDDIHGITPYDWWQVIYTGPPCTAAPGGASQPYDTHGTHVAGVIAARTGNARAIAGTVGLADVRLINVALGGVSCGGVEVAEGLYYSIAHGADIANMSLGMHGVPYLLDDAVKAARQSGMLLVASSGNDGRRITKGLDPSYAVYPADMQGVLAVGGAQPDGHRWPAGNYGPALDLIAPALNVRTITYSTPDQTVADVTDVNGTSMSAAFVSGAAAIVLGKYPQVTTDYMRSWLRATARDITDPNGTGQNLVGWDEYSGAGMLDAGVSTVALANPDDQPIAVALFAERVPTINELNPVSGRPDLAITVKGVSLQQWSLEYGAGDVPQSWTPVPIADTSLTSSQVDNMPASVGTPLTIDFNHDVVPSGYNFFNTEPLQNLGIYTLRLTAVNRAGRRFEAADRFRVARAMLDMPPPNWTIVGRWGWPPVIGITDVRSQAHYQIAFRQGTSSLWTSTPYYPAQRFADPFFDATYWPTYRQRWGSLAASVMHLLTPEGFHGSNPVYGSVQPGTLTEGWSEYQLQVTTATGAVETQSMRVYLDNSHFPYLSGWPVVQNVTPLYMRLIEDSAVAVVDMGGAIGRRIFVHRWDKLLCLNPAGSVVWSRPLFFSPSDALDWRTARAAPTFAVADVNGDGVKEIAVSGLETVNGVRKNAVYLLNQDGSPLNSNWPQYFDYQSGAPHWFVTIQLVRLADVTGDARLELLFYEPAFKYYGIPDVDIRPGWFHVLGLNGAEASSAWPKEFSEVALFWSAGDVDADGKAEILIEPNRILEGDGTPLPGWPVGNGRRASLADVTTASPQLETIQATYQPFTPNYTVHVRGYDGSTLPGWPLQFDASVPVDTWANGREAELHVLADQLVPGGDRELILCYDKLRVVDATGQPVPSLPEININGRCGGVTTADMDGDGAREYVVLVHRSHRLPAVDLRRGTYLEAYELDGTRLADSDTRWPICIESDYGWYHPMDDAFFGGQVAIADVDGQAGAEVINLVDQYPYPYGGLVHIGALWGGSSNRSYAIEILKTQ